MMKWIVGYIEANKEEWDRRRVEEMKEREESKKREEWRLLSQEEKIQKLREEEAEARSMARNSSKEDRLEAAKRLKELWKRRRQE